MVSRKVAGLYIACFGVFVYFYTLLCFEYYRRIQANQYVEWDLKTITAGDYTIEFPITSKMFTFFEINYYDPSNPIPKVAQLRYFIKDELETRFSEINNFILCKDPNHR